MTVEKDAGAFAVRRAEAAGCWSVRFPGDEDLRLFKDGDEASHYAEALNAAVASRAASARAEEREACAAVFDERAAHWRDLLKNYTDRALPSYMETARNEIQYATAAASAIRARRDAGGGA